MLPVPFYAPLEGHQLESYGHIVFNSALNGDIFLVRDLMLHSIEVITQWHVCPYTSSYYWKVNTLQMLNPTEVGKKATKINFVHEIYFGRSPQDKYKI